MNTTTTPIRIDKGTVIATYTPTTPYEYCHKGEGTQIDIATLLSKKTIQSLNNHVRSESIQSIEPTGAITNGDNIDPNNRDFTAEGGYQNVKPADQIHM